ncbi:hypothetical protein ACIBH1_37255 [Nonomuraea sp. NPDC050663]|uniref:hypothetical protein n=1 Tax=Nonomuraea sp. NPDC050663 TaxID=3364370 RepID=UPI0037A70BF8
MWSQARATGSVTALRAARTAYATVLAAGPGWTGTRLPADVVHVTDLRQALARVTAAR